MNTHVTFENAKLLKEKGFDLPMEQNGRVYCEGTGQIDSIISSDQISNWNDKCYIEICSAPTISEVVMWLYEKHGILLVALPELLNGEIVTWYSTYYEQGVGEDIQGEFITLQKAYEFGIKYTLENLI